MQNNKKKEIIERIFLIGIILIYFFLNFKFNISISCIFYELTGLFCPGCGITRMFKSIIKLDFYQAFRYNPLVFIYLICYLVYFLLKNTCLKNLKLNNKVINILLVITLVYGVLRNIELFSYLKPTIIH